MKTRPLREIAAVFLELGLTSFGGPVAHLGHFHREFVDKRRWLSEADYAQLVALTQLLPGPGSSQLGFSIGLLRGGWAGALAAFLAFTLPSALLMVAFATALPSLSNPLAQAALQGLKLVALAVVAHGLLGMARRLCPDGRRALLAALAMATLLLLPRAGAQLAVVAVGALAGWLLHLAPAQGSSVELPLRHGRRFGAALLAVFAALLLGLPLLGSAALGPAAVAEAFYRAGALVFGGGHVVLPLLEESVVHTGWITQGDFLAGYGAAQAVPGPMFSLAAFLGARLPGALGGLPGAALALGAIFLPGFLLVGGVLPWWKGLVARSAAASVVAGVNAAVVGLLAAALYDPVFTSAVKAPQDLAIAVVGFALLAGWRVSALWVVLWCVLASVGAAWL